MKTTVRFFAYEHKECGELDIIEISAAVFESMSDFPISYERHTVFENGVSQICLTRQNEGYAV